MRWGSFSVYGVKLHLVCATNGVPLSYELTSANIADVRLAEELINEAKLAEGVARRLLGDLAYRSKELRETLAEVGILLSTEPSERRRWREAANRDLLFELEEGLWSWADAGDYPGRAGHQDLKAKICAYSYALLINRHLDRPQGHIKELWA